MLQSIKDLFEEISVMPKAVKLAISTALLFAVGFSVYYGVSNLVANHKIERLENQNFDLSRQAQSATEKAARAEKNAADEALRAESLEAQIETLEAKEKLTDEKIIVQSQKSADLRGSLNRVRNSAPANTSTIDLERRLRDRYRQTVNSQ